MALSRVALRLTTLEALRPAALVGTVSPAWPTLAGDFVCDSQLDPIDDLDPQNRKPSIIVYTNEDIGTAGQHSGGPEFKREVDLAIELATLAMLKVGDDYVPGVPLTDAEIESDLDLLEAQVRFALFYGPTGSLWRKLTGRRVISITSVAHRTSEESLRLGMRTLTLKTQIPDDVFVAAPPAQQTGLDCLPEPLKSVIVALQSGCYGAKLGAGLATKAPLMPVAVPLEGVSFDMQVGAPPAAKDDGKTQINFTADNLDQP